MDPHLFIEWFIETFHSRRTLEEKIQIRVNLRRDFSDPDRLRMLTQHFSTAFSMNGATVNPNRTLKDRLLDLAAIENFLSCIPVEARDTLEVANLRRTYTWIHEFLEDYQGNPNLRPPMVKAVEGPSILDRLLMV